VTVTDRLDRLQQQHPGLGFPLAVLYKFFDDQGAYLAALITHYAFVSLFPLLLLFTTILGFVLNGNPHLQNELVNSALGQFPVIGQQLRGDAHSLRGSGLALVVGIGGSIYGGLGVAQALQNALDKIWAVPRQARPNPIKARLRSLGLLVVLGGGVIATTVLSGITTGAGVLNTGLGLVNRVVAVVLSIVVDMGIFLVAFKVLTARRLSWRQIRLGALLAAVGWEVLQLLGTYYLSHTLTRSSQVYGVFGLVLGLMAWLALEAVVIVFAAEINVIHVERLYPRSLLTPFTDNVTLTVADRRAYTSYAQTERHKGFERVDVSYDKHGRHRAGSTADEPPPAPGDTAPGHTAPGDTAPGHTAPGDTAPGDTAPGHTAPGHTAPGDTAPGDTGPRDADAPAG
jgi:inner membrane protein YhjD